MMGLPPQKSSIVHILADDQSRALLIPGAEAALRGTIALRNSVALSAAPPTLCGLIETLAVRCQFLKLLHLSGK